MGEGITFGEPRPEFSYKAINDLVGLIEPAVARSLTSGTLEVHILASIAISLKRIADDIEAQRKPSPFQDQMQPRSPDEARELTAIALTLSALPPEERPKLKPMMMGAVAKLDAKNTSQKCPLAATRSF